MLAHDPKVKERDVQELYQILHPNAPGSSRCPMIHWNALKASAVTGDPYVPKHVDLSPPLSALQLYFKIWPWNAMPQPRSRGEAKSRQPSNLLNWSATSYATRSYRVEA